MIRSFKIRRHKIHKNYVFLLSVFEGSAYWTAHEYNGDARVPTGVLSELFQTEHNKQVEGMIAEALAKEAQEFLELTVELDNKSERLLNSLPEEKRAVLLDQFNKPLNGNDHEKL